MIGALSGKLLSHAGDTLLIDVGGVGYEVAVTTSVISQLGDIGDALQVTIFTDVKENSISLFGFSGQVEKAAFLLLKKVSGIGPRLAFTIVSWLTPEELFSAISIGDVGAIQKVPGVGKKTAERLVVELREQVGALVKQAVNSPLSKRIESSKENNSVSTTHGRLSNDAVLALESLGFSSQAATSAVSQALSEHAQKHAEILADSNELLRLALGKL